MARDMADNPHPDNEEGVILVVGAPGGWMVRSAFTDGPMMFSSGARAEAAAWALARAAVKPGDSIEVQVRSRSGAVAGRKIHRAPPT